MEAFNLFTYVDKPGSWSLFLDGAPAPVNTLPSCYIDTGTPKAPGWTMQRKPHAVEVFTLLWPRFGIFTSGAIQFHQHSTRTPDTSDSHWLEVSVMNDGTYKTRSDQFDSAPNSSARNVLVKDYRVADKPPPERDVAYEGSLVWDAKHSESGPKFINGTPSGHWKGTDFALDVILTKSGAVHVCDAINAVNFNGTHYTATVHGELP